MARCERPPPGWRCSRDRGHDPPCAARPAWWNLRGKWMEAQTGTSRLNIDKAALWLCGAMLVALGLLFGFLIGVLAVS
jgi:hypothetical protein